MLNRPHPFIKLHHILWCRFRDFIPLQLLVRDVPLLYSFRLVQAVLSVPNDLKYDNPQQSQNRALKDDTHDPQIEHLITTAYFLTLQRSSTLSKAFEKSRYTMLSTICTVFRQLSNHCSGVVKYWKGSISSIVNKSHFYYYVFTIMLHVK